MRRKERYLVRLIRLHPLDERILRDYARQRKLKGRDLSPVLSTVLREWFTLRMQAACSLYQPQIYPPWDLRTEIQRIKATLKGGQPPDGYNLDLPVPPTSDGRAAPRPPGPPQPATPSGATGPVFALAREPVLPPNREAAPPCPARCPADDRPPDDNTPPPMGTPAVSDLPPRRPLRTSRQPFRPAPKPRRTTDR